MKKHNQRSRLVNRATPAVSVAGNASAPKPGNIIEGMCNRLSEANGSLETAVERLSVVADRLLGADDRPTSPGAEESGLDPASQLGSLDSSICANRSRLVRLHEVITRLENV